MAGLAFGMIFLTLAVAGGVFYFRGKSTTTGTGRGFGNPNTL